MQNMRQNLRLREGPSLAADFVILRLYLRNDSINSAGESTRTLPQTRVG